MNNLLDFSFNDESYVMTAILLAIEKAIDALNAIDTDLFKASHFCPNAIGTAKADLMDALQSLYTARSWVKEGADVREAGGTLPYIDPMDTVLKLIGFANTIITQSMNIPFCDPDDPAIEAFVKSEKNSLLCDASTLLEDAATCVERVSEEEEEKKAVNA